MDDLLTPSEAAELTRLSVDTLRWHRSQNSGPRSFRIGRKVWYQRQDVADWIQAQVTATERGGVGER